MTDCVPDGHVSGSQRNLAPSGGAQGIQQKIFSDKGPWHQRGPAKSFTLWESTRYTTKKYSLKTQTNSKQQKLTSITSWTSSKTYQKTNQQQHQNIPQPRKYVQLLQARAGALLQPGLVHDDGDDGDDDDDDDDDMMMVVLLLLLLLLLMMMMIMMMTMRSRSNDLIKWNFYP